MATPNQQAFAPNRLSKQIVAPSDTTQPPSEDTGAQQLAAAVDDLIDQLQGKFDTVSKEIFGKLDDMARRLDQLEAAIAAENESNQTT